MSFFPLYAELNYKVAFLISRHFDILDVHFLT